MEFCFVFFQLTTTLINGHTAHWAGYFGNKWNKKSNNTEEYPVAARTLEEVKNQKYLLASIFTRHTILQSESTSSDGFHRLNNNLLSTLEVQPLQAAQFRLGRNSFWTY